MRVANITSYRNYGKSVNDIHDHFNKSMNKISSGKAYESAADNPLAYYEGKRIDNQYLDTLSKLDLISDVKNRIYQQELGARDIQSKLSSAKKAVEFALSETNNNDMSIVDTKRKELLSYQQTMTNDLNSQYENFYIYGGNDLANSPFSLSADGTTLTFTHTFAGDDTPTEMVMELKKQADGTYQYDFTGTDKDGGGMDKTQTLDAIAKAMGEQGRMDIGYGTIFDRSTLIDTYTGGLNAITGLSSDEINAMDPAARNAAIEERLNNSAIALTGKAALTLKDYMDDPTETTKAKSMESLGNIMDSMTTTEHTVTTVYSDLGNKYQIMESVDERLTLDKQNMEEHYKDKLGADPYEAIMDMYSYNQSYNAALKIGSYLVNTSLFDFMR